MTAALDAAIDALEARGAGVVAAAARLIARRARSLCHKIARARLRGFTLVVPFLALVAVPILASATVILSMWQYDYMIPLDSSLRWVYGHLPHVDFHTPVGIAFWLQQGLATELIGVDPRTPIIGNALAALVILPAAVVIAERRLQGGLVGLLVLAAGLAILSPRSFDDPPGQVSFLAGYNKAGLAMFAILVAAFFVEPVRAGGRLRLAVESLTVALLLLWLFYLKISFAAIAGAGGLVALHYAPRNRAMILLGLAGAALGVAAVGWVVGINGPYFADIGQAAGAGPMLRTGKLFVDIDDSRLGLAIVALSAAFYWRASAAPGAAKVSNVVITIGIVAAGALAMNQVHDTYLPLNYVALLVLAARALQETPPAGEAAARAGFVPPLLGALSLILLPMLADFMTAVPYYAQRSAGASTRLCTDADVPACRMSLLIADAETAKSLSPWATPRAGGAGDGPPPRPLAEIVDACEANERCVFWHVQAQLIDMLNHSLKADDRPYLLGFSNPIPYLYQLEPPRHVLAWSDVGRNLSAASHPDATGAFSDVTLLVIPKVDFGSGLEPGLVPIYAGDVARLFVKVEESDCWEIWRRREAE